MTPLEELKIWISKEKETKTKWWHKALWKKNQSEFEKESVLKVYGKINFMGDLESKIRQIEKKHGQQKMIV